MCGLKDLGFNGFPFTWCNWRPGYQNTWIQLDRVATIDWILRFPTSRIHHLDAFHSDHKPIILISDSEDKRFYRKGRPFRFEAMWLKDKTCEGVIKESWSGCPGLSPLRMVPIKLTTCQDNLLRWNREVFGHVRLTLARKLKELTKAEEADLYRSNPAHIYQLRDEIQVLKNREEAMWQQRPHTDWLKGGD